MTPLGLVAAGSAAVAAALVWPPVPRPATGSPPGRLRPLVWLTTGLAVAGPTTGRGAVLAGIAIAAGVALVALHRRQTARTAARTVAGRVVECCDLLASELTAGRPPGVALDAAAREWSLLTPAAEALSLGGDVPATLRVLSRTSGAEELRLVAAAWQVAHRTGQGLATTVERVAAGLRAAEATNRIVTAELASARATGRLVAVLPVLVLLMGSGVGGNPWLFLTTSPWVWPAWPVAWVSASGDCGGSRSSPVT